MAAIDFLLLLSSVLLFGLPAIIDHLRRHHPNESDLVGQVANATHHILQHMVRNFTRLFFCLHHASFKNRRRGRMPLPWRLKRPRYTSLSL